MGHMQDGESAAHRGRSLAPHSCLVSMPHYPLPGYHRCLVSRRCPPPRASCNVPLRISSRHVIFDHRGLHCR
jgi:hypothetical protein